MFKTDRSKININTDRRQFISASAIMALGMVAPEKEKDDNTSDVLPNEDLMREHGILRRILLIYEKCLVSASADSKNALEQSAKIIRDFIENYHEKLEEDFIFPRFRKKQKNVELVDTLLQQHNDSRKLTDIILNVNKEQDFEKIKKAIFAFIYVYRPHAAREDTVLFPQFREIVSTDEYKDLGEEFEKRETQLFGEKGFETKVDEVASIEKKLGIYELSIFNPKI